jgi:ABC-type dipeptide/oligopeptide/nickel transport system permease component
MTGYVVRRLIRLVLVVLGALTVIFLLQRLAGDPVALLLPDLATEEQIVAVRAELGIDQPLIVQYTRFIGNFATGDFGFSYGQRRPVRDIVFEKLPATLYLAAVSVLLATVFGTILGVIGARWRGRAIDRTVVFGALLGQSIPTFWLGIIAILVFSVRLGWLPTSGNATWKHVILPAATLSAFSLARTARVARSSMIEALSQGYTRTTRAKGLSEFQVVFVHALKNASISILTITAFMFSTLMGGALVTEVVFAWPGIGRLLVDSVLQRDFPVVQGAVFVIAVVVVLTYTFLDLIYTFLDPRIEVHE